jgi:NTE family protein
MPREYTPPKAAPRPRIGLALSSGIARGWAHIGVIHALVRAGFAPDIICGTSIGALVGGVYLADHLHTLEAWARGLTKMKLTRYLDVQIGGGGLIAGKRLAAMLYEALGDRTIESLPKPLACVTTELNTGHEIWLQKGGLVDAIRASYALPGVFTPVQLDGRWLMDGALVNPIPVTACRALGARLVIAVNLNADTFGRGRVGERVAGSDEFAMFEEGASRGFSLTRPIDMLTRQMFGHERDAPNMFGVMVAALNIVQDRLSRSRLAGDPPDVMVTPRLGHVGLLEFHRADEAIKEGEAAMLRAMPHLTTAMAALAV